MTSPARQRLRVDDIIWQCFGKNIVVKIIVAYYIAQSSGGVHIMEETTGKSYTGYDLKRVDTVNLIATWSVAFVFILLNFTTDGFASGYDMAKSLAVGLWPQGFIF